MANSWNTIRPTKANRVVSSWPHPTTVVEFPQETAFTSIAPTDAIIALVTDIEGKAEFPRETVSKSVAKRRKAQKGPAEAPPVAPTGPEAAPEPVPADPVAVEPLAVDPLAITTPLEAIELYHAAEETVTALTGSVWGSFAKLVAESPDPEKALDEAEKAFKAKHPGTKLPNPYRSAKSIALTARKLGIVLVDSAGKAIGKTAIQGTIAQMRADAAKDEADLAEATRTGAPVAEKDYLGVFLRATQNLTRVYKNLSREHREQVQAAIDVLLG